MRRVLVAIAMTVAIVVAAISVSAFAQTAPKPVPRPAAPVPKVKPGTEAVPAQAAPAAAPAENQDVLPSHWTSRCVSEARNSNVECAVEQSAIVTKTGQLLADVTIRVPADTRRPVMLIQLPVGLYLPVGVTIQIDSGKAQQIILQTCDLKGCYAAEPVADDMLAAMKIGTKFAISFQNTSKETVVIPFGLSNFGEAYQHTQ